MMSFAVLDLTPSGILLLLVFTRTYRFHFLSKLVTLSLKPENLWPDLYKLFIFSHLGHQTPCLESANSVICLFSQNLSRCPLSRNGIYRLCGHTEAYRYQKIDCSTWHSQNDTDGRNTTLENYVTEFRQ